MAKKSRLEDLGRISVMLSYIYDHKLFDLYDGAPKRINEWWPTLTEDQKYEFLNSIAYGLQEIKFSLADIMCIASGDEETKLE